MFLPDNKAYQKYPGSQRLIEPTVTIDYVKSLMPVMGITRISNVTGLDHIGINVVMVVRPNSRSVSVSQGKGVTLNDAIASGLMESAESWHAERIPTEKIIVACRSSLGNSVDLNELPRINDCYIDDEMGLHWITGIELFSQQQIYLPLDLVHSNFTDSRISDNVFINSTNGLASGNHFIEAALHAIYEVVERDAISLWNAAAPGHRMTTRVDINSINNETCNQLLQKYFDADIAVGIWDITSDINIPTFICSITPQSDKDSFTSWSAVGSGTHLDVYTALRRAITEAAQIRATCIVGAREDLITSEYLQYQQQENRIIHSYIEACKTGTLINIETIKSNASDSLDGDLKSVLTCLSNAGLKQVVAVDLTRNDLNIPVVRIVIPGLEGPDEHRFYTPGKRAKAVADG